MPSWVHQAQENNAAKRDRLHRQTHKGQILLDGIDVTKLPENQLYKIRRDKMGFVFQTFNLLPYLNARENVELPMEGKIKSKVSGDKRASELLAMVGFRDGKSIDRNVSARGTATSGHSPRLSKQPRHNFC